MSTYAIGDLQGCLSPLKKLLQKISYDEKKDQLWFVGDLVNRGPESLATLQFVRALGDNCKVVLGNHDLHLLAVVYGMREASPKDTVQDIVDSPDCQELCDWLRQQALLYHDTNLDYTMVHAGLHPSWDLSLAKKLAQEVSLRLKAPDFKDFLQAMYGNRPANWQPNLTGMERARFTVNCLTRMRYLTDSNELDFTCTEPPEQAPANLIPWFEAKGRKSQNLRIVTGHWSSLGTRATNGVLSLDTGCVWGNSMTALELETGQYHSMAC